MKAAEKAEKERAKKKELGLTVAPPTPTTRSYMRRALPLVSALAASTKEKEKETRRTEVVDSKRGARNLRENRGCLE